MNSRPNKSFHHGNLRAALLESALNLLDEGGVNAVTIRATARNAGVSHAAPINHFRDRKALLTALAESSFIELSDAITKGLSKQGSNFSNRIKAFSDAIVNYGINNPNRYRLLWTREAHDSNNKSLNDTMDLIYAQLINEITGSVETNKFDTDTFAIALWSLCHGYVSLRIDGNIEQGVDSITGQTRHHAIIDSYFNKT